MEKECYVVLSYNANDGVHISKNTSIDQKFFCETLCRNRNLRSFWSCGVSCPKITDEVVITFLNKYRKKGAHPLSSESKFTRKVQPDAIFALCDIVNELEKTGPTLLQEKPEKISADEDSAFEEQSSMSGESSSNYELDEESNEQEMKIVEDDVPYCAQRKISVQSSRKCHNRNTNNKRYRSEDDVKLPEAKKQRVYDPTKEIVAMRKKTENLYKQIRVNLLKAGMSAEQVNRYIKELKDVKITITINGQTMNQ